MNHLRKFLSIYCNKKTMYMYKWALKKFFKSVYGKIKDLRMTADRHFNEKRNYEEDIQGFFIHTRIKPPKNVRLVISTVIYDLKLINAIDVSLLNFTDFNRREKLDSEGDIANKTKDYSPVNIVENVKKQREIDYALIKDKVLSGSLLTLNKTQFLEKHPELYEECKRRWG